MSRLKCVCHRSEKLGVGVKWEAKLGSPPLSSLHKPRHKHKFVSYPSLVLVQPRKIRPYITERLLMGRKESNQTNKQNKFVSVYAAN